MKNIKTRFYILWFFTVITLWFTYAYSSVSSSLNYLRNAWDIGHIGYIITEMFGPDAKIKSAYLPDGMVVENASITQTWIVKLNNATGSTSEIEAPTINILTQVWTHLNDRIDNFPQYVHPTGDGNLHVPATSTSNNGKVLTAGSTEWSISWQTLPSAPVSSVAGKTGAVTLLKWDVGLSNVDNTSDANKPVSTATQTELDLKANIASPTFTGEPTAPTPNTSDVSTKIATTAYVYAKINALADSEWVSFAWYTALTYSGSLGYKKWADQKCNDNFPWSRVMMYDDYLKLGNNYPYTNDVWLLDGAEVFSFWGDTGSERYYTKDGSLMGTFNLWYWVTCLGWNQWTAVRYWSTLLTTWAISMSICNSTKKLACVY